MKNYLIKCFVRKNSNTIRERLIELGVHHNEFDDNDGEWISNDCGIFISVNPGFENNHPDSIDCGTNVDTFLGLSSITDENVSDIDINSLIENLTSNKSICWKCMNSCDVSNKLKNEGYCGCAYPLTKGLTFREGDKDELYELINGNIIASEMGSGWIYNRRNPYGLGIDYMSGSMINDSLIVKNCTKCRYFKEYGKDM